MTKDEYKANIEKITSVFSQYIDDDKIQDNVPEPIHNINKAIDNMKKDIIALTNGFNKEKAENLYDKLFDIASVVSRMVADSITPQDVKPHNGKDTKSKSKSTEEDKKNKEDVLNATQKVTSKILGIITDKIGIKLEKELKKHRKENSKTVKDTLSNIMKTIANAFSVILNKLNSKWGHESVTGIFSHTADKINLDKKENKDVKNSFVSNLEKSLKPYYVKLKEPVQQDNKDQEPLVTTGKHVTEGEPCKPQSSVTITDIDICDYTNVAHKC